MHSLVQGLARRDFLKQVGAGFPALALIDLLTRDGYFSQAHAQAPPVGRSARVPAKAKHCVFLFMNGAPSQVDTFDYKPALTRWHDQPYRGDTPIGSNGRPVGNLMQTPTCMPPFCV